MEYGFVIPTRPPMASFEGIAAIAAKGEELGFAIVAVPDHIAPPPAFEDPYPYSESGNAPWGPSGHMLELVTLLAFLAGRTSRLRLLTSVMVLPLRHPVVAAKMLATLDVLSQGRLIVGCGLGWEHKEFANVGAPPFAERGRVADEYISFFRELWTSESPSFDGTYARFDGAPFLPKPFQSPHPPIWIGGESTPAMKRAGRLGDGWYPNGLNYRYPLDTPQRFAQAVARLHGYAEEAGRDPAAIDLGYDVSWQNDGTPQRLDDGGRRALTGSAQDAAGDIDRLAEAGVRHIVMHFTAPTLEETLARMERFATEVMPLAG